MAKRMTHEEFLKRIEVMGKGNFTVLSVYTKSNEPIKIKHNICGHEFITTPYNLTRHGKPSCPKCSICHQKSQEEFEKIIIEKFKGKYTVMGKFKNNSTPIKLKCNRCNYIFEILPKNLLITKRINEDGYCPLCSTKTRYDFNSFKEKVKRLVGNEYTILSETFQTVDDKIKIRHNKCSYEYEVTPYHFINRGQRCPICNSLSSGEIRIYNWLKAHNFKVKKEYKFDDLKDKDFLKFDFKVDIGNNNFVLIEFDGIQHTKAAKKGFFTEETFKKLREHDRMKNEYCKNKDILLIRIPYEEFDNIENILSEKLLEVK